MGIRSTIHTKLKAAFDGPLADVVVAFTLNREVQGGSYDPVTDETLDLSSPNVSRGVFEALPAKEQPDTNAKFLLEKLIVIGNEIDVEPVIDDTLTLANGIEYRVVNPNPVMGGSTLALIYEMIVVKTGSQAL